MMVSDLKEFIETQVLYTYVVNTFHEYTQDNCCAVILGSNGSNTRTTADYEFQFLVRNSDPEQAESIAFQIYNFFNNKYDYVIGTTNIIMSKGLQAVPIYTGIDKNGRTIYSINIHAIVDN